MNVVFRFGAVLTLIFLAIPQARADAPADWIRRLDKVEAALNAPKTSAADADAARADLRALRDAALSHRGAALDKVAEVEGLIVTLGPAPATGEKEGPTVASQRQRYAEDLAAAKGEVQVADLTLARVDNLSSRISERWRFWVWGTLTKVFPAPFAAATLVKAGQETQSLAGSLLADLRAPQTLGAGGHLDLGAVMFAALTAGLIALTLGFWLWRRYGRADTSVTARIARTLTACLVSGLVPAFWLGGLGLWIEANGLSGEGRILSGLFALGLQGLALVVAAWTLPRALYGLDAPAFRALPVSDRRARALALGLFALGVVIALDRFLTGASLLVAVPTDALASTYGALSSGLIAFSGIYALQARHDRGHEGALESAFARKAAQAVALILSLILAFGFGAACVGYANLSAYLTNGAVITGLGFAVTLAARGLTLNWLTARQGPQPDLPDAGDDLSVFWWRLGVDTLATLIVAVIAALSFGVPGQEVQAWGERALGAFRIGSIRIAPADLALALIAFAISLSLTKRTQSALEQSLLPNTKLEMGVRQSIVTATGYLGTVAGLLIAVATVGIDLSSIALVAGALSVGIGFGLQNITNNFISGLILLFERPIKVGDWVVVGSTEGIVKRINVRSTVIETFDLADVIMPNAELLGTHVTNWTHKDKRGRVEVKVSVDLDADPEVVRQVLLDVVARRADVLAEPAPFVTFTAIQTSGLDFAVRCFTDDALTRGTIASDLRYELVKALRARDIDLARAVPKPPPNK